MCCYCMIGDHFFKYDPPFAPTQPNPFIPQPAPGVVPQPWDLQRLVEFYDLLRRVKELEDKLGCPCEPNKADYLGLIAERITKLEKIQSQLGEGAG